MFQKISFITLFILFSFTLIGQDLTKDFEEIISKMETSKSVSIQVNVKMYGSKGGSLIYTSHASVDKMGEDYINVLSEMVFISTNDYSLKIDHEEKAVLIINKKNIETPKDEEKISEYDVKRLRDFLITNQNKVIYTISLLSNSSGIKTYSISGVRGMKEMLITLDMNNKTIKKVCYEYDSRESNSRYIELEYHKFIYDVNLSQKFDLSSYFRIENNKYVLSTALQGYNLYTEE